MVGDDKKWECTNKKTNKQNKLNQTQQKNGVLAVAITIFYG